MEEDQDKIVGAVGSEVVQNFLQKYKVEELVHLFSSSFAFLLQPNHVSSASLQGFRIDLTCKQLTVDFVNQSVLQMSSHDVEGKRSDKTDFAEKLGAMNRRWQILQGLIGEKVGIRPLTSRLLVVVFLLLNPCTVLL